MKIFPVRKTVIALILIVSLYIPGYSQERIAEPVWRAALRGMMIGNPVSQVESVALVLDSGNLCCYSIQGNLLWSYYAGGRLGPFITRSREGTSYICRTNGMLIAVNRSGRELWRKNLGAALFAPVITGWDGRIFVPTEKRLSCYTAAGYLLWSQSFGAPVILGPVKDLQGGVILGLEGGTILHINHFGETRSFEPAEKPVLVVPVLSRLANEENGDTSSQDRLMLIAAGQSGNLNVLGDDAEDVSLPSLPGTPLHAVSRNGNIAFTLQNNRIILMSYEDKTILWGGESQNLTASAPDSVNMLYDERGIYVVSQNGASGFTEDGRRLWIINIRGSAAMPSFSDEGLLYSGGADWILYAYRLEERVLGIKQSVYGPAPEGFYGLGNPGPSSWSGYYFRNDEAEIRRELRMIEERILSGRIGVNEAEYTAYLMETASGAISDSRLSAFAVIHTAHRVKALQLLSFIGSRETIPFLVSIFNRDPDPSVQAAAASAIGKIGVDPEGTALKAFNMKIYSPAVQRNEQVLTAVAEAAASLCRFSGPPLSEDGIKLLVLLADNAMPRLARKQAEKELKILR